MAAVEPAIRVENLSFRYPPFDPNQPDTESWALENIQLSVAAGEFLGVTGTTSSGKSTLCLVLNGLVPQQTSGTIRGDVWVGDLNTKRTPVPEISTRVGLVFQDPEANFLGLTVEDELAFGPENLGVAPAEIDRRVDWALETVGMLDHRYHSVANLSGGQKQRVAIASALTIHPSVLVLDEPTAELDPVGKMQVAAALSELRRSIEGVTIVMASNDPEMLTEFADRIIVLDQGRIVLSGPPSEVYADVEPLIERGVRVPELGVLAARLRQTGQGMSFLRLDDAEAALSIALKSR